MTIRTLHVRPEAVLDLLKSITAGHELIAAGGSIPAEAAVGKVRFNESARMFEIEIVSRWPKDADNPDVVFEYSVRQGPDLGPVRTLGAAPGDAS